MRTTRVEVLFLYCGARNFLIRAKKNIVWEVYKKSSYQLYRVHGASITTNVSAYIVRERERVTG